MVAKLRLELEHDRATAAQLFNWLVQCDVPAGGDMRLYCQDVSRRIAEQKPQAMQVADLADYQTATQHTRTINYWSEHGEFFRWRYTVATMNQTYMHVASLADDRTVNFTWDDVVRVHGLIRFMELTQDCQDAVGW